MDGVKSKRLVAGMFEGSGLVNSSRFERMVGSTDISPVCDRGAHLGSMFAMENWSLPSAVR